MKDEERVQYYKTDLMQTSHLINRVETIVESDQQILIGFISETNALLSSQALCNNLIFHRVDTNLDFFKCGCWFLRWSPQLGLPIGCRSQSQLLSLFQVVSLSSNRIIYITRGTLCQRHNPK
jgi:hypothetical protein